MEKPPLIRGWGPINPFAIDPRSLAALRVGLAGCLFWELGERLPDLAALYSDAGVLPRAELLAISADRLAPSLSLALMGGELWSQALLFAATAVAAAALLVGYRTRLSTFMCWLLLSAIQVRNPFVVFGAGVFLRMLLFWGVFLPLGARFSLDRRLAGVAAVPTRKPVFSIATCGLQMQIAIVFVVAGLAKMVNPVWRDGLGVAYALDYEPIATQLGRALAQFPALCTLVTYAVVSIELGGTILLFSPFFAPSLRTAVLVAMTGMLVGFGLTLRVGLFPLVSFVALLAFIPGELWDYVGGFTRATPRPAAPAPGPRPRSPLAKHRSGRESSVVARAGDGLAAVTLVFILLWNIGLWRDAGYRPPAALGWFGETLQLRQRWGMFTRLPSTGWLRMPGTLRDGTPVDLFSAGGPLPDYEQAVAGSLEGRPPLVSSTFKSVPWLVFFLSITENPGRASDQLQGYGRYLCREWNAREVGARQLQTFEMIYMHRAVDPRPSPGVDRKYDRQVIWTHRCFG